MIYLDNAATSFPKPRSVCDEVTKCMRFYCGNPGRGAHSLAMAAAEKIYECREVAADLLGCKNAENIVFTLNTTQSLNMAIKGILRPGDHVIISDMEHNSVFRPIYKLAKEGSIEYDIFNSMTGNAKRSAVRICAQIARLVRPNTKLVVCNHSSNVCSATLPIKEIADFCHKHKILLIVDAAQSAGHLPINMGQMNIDIACVPGHKGLLGPSGCGILAFKDNIALDTIFEGGNGIMSLRGDMPDFSPERYEAGTVAVPAIAGLCEGIKIVRQIGADNIHKHEQMLYTQTLERLKCLDNIKIYVPEYTGSVLLFNVNNIDPEQVGKRLNEAGICVRCGFHCAPLAHKTLRTSETGAVRISFGIYNTLSDIEVLYETLKKISK